MLISLKSNALPALKLFLRKGSVEGEWLEPSSLPCKCHEDILSPVYHVSKNSLTLQGIYVILFSLMC